MSAAASQLVDVIGRGNGNESLGVLRLPRAVLLGSGQRHAVGHVVAELGTRALVCTDERLSRSHELAEIVGSLEEAGVKVVVYDRTPPELPAPAITGCVHFLNGTAVDVVVGLGGGSCLDMAKVVAVLLAHGGEPADYYGEYLVPGPAVPVVAIPTTSGTGSEATPVAVVSDPRHTMKVGISSPHLIPHTAICDPDLTRSCPPSLTASTGADALSHLVESFTAVRRVPTARLAKERVFVGKSVLTDAVAAFGLRLIDRSVRKAYAGDADTAVREEAMIAAFAGGVALGSAGTAAAHALQYPIGALTHTSHGVGVGALLPYVMRYNFPARVPEFAEIGRILGVAPAASADQDDVAAARAGVLAVDSILDDLGIPRTLEELGLHADRVEYVAEQGLQAKRLVENNPRPLNHAAMLSITRAAFDDDRTFPPAWPPDARRPTDAYRTAFDTHREG